MRRHRAKCIRLRQRWPDKRFLFVPEARVLHHIDTSRMTVGRFLWRCYFEGGSKAVIAWLVGAQDALARERQYTREVLPGASNARWSSSSARTIWREWLVPG